MQFDKIKDTIRRYENTSSSRNFVHKIEKYNNK